MKTLVKTLVGLGVVLVILGAISALGVGHPLVVAIQSGLSQMTRGL
jgi:hypothetical protein